MEAQRESNRGGLSPDVPRGRLSYGPTRVALASAGRRRPHRGVPVSELFALVGAPRWGSRSPVVLGDHAAEHFASLDRQVQRNVGLVVVIGWSLLAGLVRAVAVVMGDVDVQDR